MTCDIIYIQEQHDEEHAYQPSKTVMRSELSRSSGIRLIALMIMSVAALILTTEWIFQQYNHHDQLFESSISRGLESTNSDLSISIGPMVISTSSTNIPSSERQALQDLYESTHGAHWNYGSSST